MNPEPERSNGSPVWPWWGLSGLAILIVIVAGPGPKLLPNAQEELGGPADNERNAPSAACLAQVGAPVGSAPPFCPLSAKIAWAENIAVVTIEKLEPLDSGGPSGSPTHRVTVSVVDWWRGDLGKTFTFTLSPRSSTRKGSRALVFVGGPFEHPAYSGDKPLTTGSQDLIVVDDLVKADSPELGEQALRVLQTAVRSYRPSEDKMSRALNDECAAVFFDALNSKSPHLRAWVSRDALYGMWLTPYVGRRLVEALGHEDAEVHTAAADALLSGRFRDARQELEVYCGGLPESHGALAHRIRSYLATFRIEDHLLHMDARLRERILEPLKRLDGVFVVVAGPANRLSVVSGNRRDQMPDGWEDDLVAYLRRMGESERYVGFTVRLWHREGLLQVQVE
jgi:hypothetical protein